jgi:hypothetical protein
MSNPICPKLSKSEARVDCQQNYCQNWITVYDVEKAVEIQDCAFNLIARALFDIANKLSRLTIEKKGDICK